jgi:hypothetical protein
MTDKRKWELTLRIDLKTRLCKKDAQLNNLESLIYSSICKKEVKMYYQNANPNKNNIVTET